MASPPLWRRLGPAITSLGLAAAAATAASAAPPPGLVARPDADLLLFAVRIERELLPELLPAYEAGDNVLLPLGGLSQLLELGIEVDVASAVATGFVLRPERTFHLEARKELLTLAGRSASVPAGAVEVHRDDIYVASRLLERWLPVTLMVDERAAVLTVLPREPLPGQLRRQRERRATTLRGAAGGDLPQPMRLPTPYRQFDRPFVDLTARATAGDAATAEAASYSALLSGDLLHLEALLFLSGSSSDPFADARLSLGRRDPHGGLLGPLRATELVLGESFHPGIELITAAGSGPGFVVTNFPLGHTTRFDVHTFVGELPAGWEVELYREDELLGYQASRADGRFEFREVPLLFGTNRFRLIFYGPHGERREDSESFEVGRSLTPPGRFHYRLAANDPETAAPRGHLEVEYGLGRRLSLGLSAAAVEVDGEARRYLDVGLRGSWRRFFVTLDAVGDDASGFGLQGRLQTRFGRLGVTLQQTQLDGFRSEAIRSPFGEIATRTLLRLDGAVPLPGTGSLPLLLFLRRDRLVAGGSQSELGARVSGSRRGLFFANELLWSETDVGIESARRAQGKLLVSRFAPRLSLRGELGYELEPQGELSEVAFTGERQLRHGYFLAIGARRALASGVTHYLLELAKRQGAFGLGALFDYSEQGGLLATASISFGAAADPFAGGWRTDAQPLAAMGAIAVRAFVDADGDGAQDPKEAPLPEVGFSIDGVPRGERTDARGVVLISRVPVHQEVDVRLIAATLEDPLHLPARPQVAVVPRAGRVVVLDFPVLATGEITGTVSRHDGGDSWGASGVRLQLVDESGKIAHETRTGYDGFYDLTRVLPGRYLLRVEPEQARRLASVPPDHAVHVPPGGAILDGVDLAIVGTGSGTGTREQEMVAVVPPPRAGEPSPPVPREPPAPAAGGATPLAPAPGSPAVDRRGRGPSYGVQMASYRNPQLALTAAQRCSRELALPCDVAAVDLGAKGLWHRVVVGRLATLAEASQLRRRLESRDEPPGPVVQLPPGQEALATASPRAGSTSGAAAAPAATTYALQVASVRRRDDAAQLAATLGRELGVPAQVATADLDSLGVWHRVLLGNFETAAEADALRGRLAHHGDARTALVRRLRAGR